MINCNSGTIHPPTSPVFAQPGDTLMLCALPGMSDLCYSIENGTCLVLRNPCVVKKLSDEYPNGATVMLQTNDPTLHVNKIQPSLDPLPHCIIMGKRNSHFFTRCVKELKPYENMTIPVLPTDVGMKYRSFHLSAIIQISDLPKPTQNHRLIILFWQTLFVSLTLLLLIKKKDVY